MIFFPSSVTDTNRWVIVNHFSLRIWEWMWCENKCSSVLKFQTLSFRLDQHISLLYATNWFCLITENHNINWSNLFYYHIKFNIEELYTEQLIKEIFPLTRERVFSLFCWMSIWKCRGLPFRNILGRLSLKKWKLKFPVITTRMMKYSTLAAMLIPFLLFSNHRFCLSNGQCRFLACSLYESGLHLYLQVGLSILWTFSPDCDIIKCLLLSSFLIFINLRTLLGTNT